MNAGVSSEKERVKESESQSRSVHRLTYTYALISINCDAPDPAPDGMSGGMYRKRLTCNKHVKMISHKSYMNMHRYMKCTCISL